MTVATKSQSPPSITFSVPSLSVTPSNANGRGSLDASHQSAGSGSGLGLTHGLGAGAAGQLSPLPLPRPPRCLTPYPDISGFPHSLEPSPLSSPAFSAYSMNSAEEDADDREESESEPIKPPARAEHGTKPIMSPRQAGKADNARLLAPALHMSHLNSPTDLKFRELPLSPIRRLKAGGSATPSPLASPTLSSGSRSAEEDDEDKGKKRPEPIQLSLRRVTGSIADVVGVKCGSKKATLAHPPREKEKDEAVLLDDEKAEGSTPGSTAVPVTSKRVGRAGSAAGDLVNIKGVQELQVHVETVE